MIIFSGFGFLVPIIALAVYVAVQWLTDQVLGAGFYTGHAVPKFAAAIISAVLLFAFGLFLKRRGTRVVIDKATGEELVLRSRHTLFFVPMEYWGGVILVLGILVAFAR